MTDGLRRFLAGTLLAAVPAAIFWLVVFALVTEVSWTLLAIAACACVLVWLPLAISRVLLRVAGRSGLGSHLVTMFLVTCLPMLSIYRFAEFSPDSSISWEINDGGVHTVDFAIAGALIALVVALLNVAGMLIYWRRTLQRPPIGGVPARTIPSRPRRLADENSTNLADTRPAQSAPDQ